VPKSSGSLTAVVVSGGKQYRVASGDRILVDRVAAEPGSELRLARVLMLVDGDSLKLGPEAIGDQVVTARVIEHRRGPKIDVLRYKPKKRVRVHRGARADLTALEIVSVGSPTESRPAPTEKAPKAEKATTEQPERATAETDQEASAQAAGEAEDAPAENDTEARDKG
jgi:large subunit ribosomal protein L21